jgi:hypothetical protein
MREIAGEFRHVESKNTGASATSDDPPEEMISLQSTTFVNDTTIGYGKSDPKPTQSL